MTILSLWGICHLQKMGVCHRDMSLENNLLDKYKTSVVIDLGMWTECLRVLYPSKDDGDGEGGVTDVLSGTQRVLIRASLDTVWQAELHFTRDIAFGGTL